MQRLQKKVAVITGACSGIGLATTELFLSEGTNVAAADVQDDVGEQLQQQYAGQLHFAHRDGTQLDELRAAICSAAEYFGGLDSCSATQVASAPWAAFRLSMRKLGTTPKTKFHDFFALTEFS